MTRISTGPTTSRKRRFEFLKMPFRFYYRIRRRFTIARRVRDLMSCSAGHTHGGQLCLPGGIPIKLEARLPRAMGAGAWRYADMVGHTSVGVGTSILPVRLNCPPEVTLHTLRRP